MSTYLSKETRFRLIDEKLKDLKVKENLFVFTCSDEQVQINDQGELGAATDTNLIIVANAPMMFERMLRIIHHNESLKRAWQNGFSNFFDQVKKQGKF